MKKMRQRKIARLTSEDAQKFFAVLKDNFKISKSEFARRIGRRPESIHLSGVRGQLRIDECRTLFKDIDFLFQKENILAEKLDQIRKICEK